MRKYILYFFVIWIIAKSLYVYSITRPVILHLPSSYSMILSDEFIGQDLFEYLVKSRYWHVQSFPNRTMCTFRDFPTKSGDMNDDSSTKIYIVAFNNRATHKQKSVLESTLSSITNMKITCSLVRDISHGHKLFSSSMTIKLGANVYLFIQESSPRRIRSKTMSFLEYFGRILNTLREENIERFLEDEGSICYSANEVDFLDVTDLIIDPQRGSISGWANVGRKGHIELSFQNTSTKDVINQEKRFRTNERIGWSDNRAQKFYFSCDRGFRFSGEIQDVRMSILFYPEYKKPIEVCSTNVAIRVWSD